MFQRLARAAAAAALLTVFFVALHAPAQGQGIGVYRGRQGRKVGSVTLPTPPFNPNAGILNGRAGRRRETPKSTSRRKPATSVKAANRRHTRTTHGRRRVRRPRPSH